ncbi:MAG: MurR/RpiR family transcriptional regulator [Melioribacteraceae bacterium]|nr:MurR/RpiR family transcriptional regulator [Melioribacteraceae bacterium]MCF8263765.1 MurR/RpiR family transcriptional regulator [Melioribacteraceae bacterium]MCF8412781.1 MurR/RpiR family transcriptional regulator [Melioribacteraceae bacterium]MCF8430638.1 MurR/RpiR family transcriptional regulator [Melioribacteraceae bacterium]
MRNYYEFLEELIRSKNKEFTATEKKIANFVLAQYKEIPFLSIHDFAERIGVGRASIMRFTKKLGFEGFLSLKKEINTRMMNTLAPMEKFRLSLDHEVSQNTFLNEVGETEVNNINQTLNNYNPKSYKQAVDLISKANIVYTVGYNLSSFLADILSYLLQRIGAKSLSTSIGGRSLVDQLMNLDKKDVVVTISLPPYSTETIDAAKYAKQHGVKVISFTDSYTSPIVSVSDIILLVKTESQIFSNSFSAISVIFYALVYEVAVKNKPRSLEALNERLNKKFN